MTETSDHRLVHKCIAGEESAWEDLLQRYDGWVRAVVRRSLRHFLPTASVTDEEEIAALTFRRLCDDDFRLLRMYRGPETLGTWLKVIAATSCREYARGRIRYTERLRRFREQILPDSVPSPAESAEISEEIERLRSGLEKIPPRDRIALELRYLHDLPHDRIAGALRVATGTVGTLLRRALDRLRDSLPL